MRVRALKHRRRRQRGSKTTTRRCNERASTRMPPTAIIERRVDAAQISRLLRRPTRLQVERRFFTCMRVHTKTCDCNLNYSANFTHASAAEFLAASARAEWQMMRHECFKRKSARTSSGFCITRASARARPRVSTASVDELGRRKIKAKKMRNVKLARSKVFACARAFARLCRQF